MLRKYVSLYESLKIIIFHLILINKLSSHLLGNEYVAQSAMIFLELKDVLFEKWNSIAMNQNKLNKIHV